MEISEAHHDTLVIYRSSAGSGKTYTLTREYLYFALKDGDRRAYRRILAVTFTNKAMQEMKDRIISKLAAFAGGNTTDGMAVELIERLGWKEERFVTASASLLSAILHNYSHFSITTIDAFFQQIIRSFARELHISGGYRLELEQDLVYRQVIQELMNEADEDLYVRKWLEGFSFSKLDDARAWEVETELLSFIKQLDSESFREIEKEVRGYEDSLYKDLRDRCQAVMKRFENDLENKARKIISLIERCGLDRRDFSRAAAANFFYNAVSKDYRSDPKKEPTITFIAGIEKGAWFKKNPSGELVPRIAELEASEFQQMAEDLYAYWNAGLRDYRTAQAVYRNIYVFALAVSLLKKLADFKKDNDILFISDATRLIRDLVRNTDAPFIYEKVGSFYDHFLIDEFQDTSRFQWDSFKPLVENSLAQGKSNLIVGDVKQSIYRWRGGDLSLLQSEVERDFGHFRPQGKNLDRNFRSRPNIISFNNTLFASIFNVLEQSYNEKVGSPDISVKDELTNVFADVRQEFAGQSLVPSGYVECRAFKGTQSFKDGVYDALMDVIHQLQDRQVPLRDTAILVRDNKDGRNIAEYLMNYRNEHPDSSYRYDVVSNETLHLSASAAIRAIISTLKYIENPQDKVARKALLYYRSQLLGESAEDLFMHDDEAVFSGLLSEILGLKKLPLYSVVERLIAMLGLDNISWEFPYLQTFQDQVLAFMKRERGDIEGFLQFWEDKLNSESIRVADDLDAIRILTIHKSKGLEFHSVIMPFVNWEWSKSDGLNWFKLDNVTEMPTALVPVRFSGMLDKTHFSGEYEREVYRNYLDNLNLLYVAFTRARHDLWFFLERSGKGLNKISDVLYELFHQESFTLADYFDGPAGIFSFGEKNFRYLEAGHDSTGTVSLEKYNTCDWQRSLKLKPVPGRSRNENQRISISTGLLAHDILSKVKYLEDLEDALKEARFSMGINDIDFEGLRAKLGAAFENSEVKGWFEPGWHVRNEQGIFSQGEEYRPDRVIYRTGETLVIDYKTGSPKQADLNQMQQYLQLVRQLYPESETHGKILYLEDMQIISVS